MKAILLIDMPTECIECQFCRVLADDKITETRCILTAKRNEDGVNTRAEWCPLKPLPETKDVGYPIDDYAVGFGDGWDACLKEITK